MESTNADCIYRKDAVKAIANLINETNIKTIGPDDFIKWKALMDAIEEILKIDECNPELDAKELAGRLEAAEAERDAAIEQLHGYCPACKHYTPNHGVGQCSMCKHEYRLFRGARATDNWAWKGR